MKKFLTLALLLGFTSTLSAQYLMRIEKTRVKGDYENKEIMINLDTMPYIQYVVVWLNIVKLNGVRKIYFKIGDGENWILLDENKEIVNGENWVSVLNYLYKINWVFSHEILSMSEGSSTNISYFKRK